MYYLILYAITESRSLEGSIPGQILKVWTRF